MYSDPPPGLMSSRSTRPTSFAQGNSVSGNNFPSHLVTCVPMFPELAIMHSVRTSSAEPSSAASPGAAMRSTSARRTSRISTPVSVFRLPAASSLLMSSISLRSVTPRSGYWKEGTTSFPLPVPKMQFTVGPSATHVSPSPFTYVKMPASAPLSFAAICTWQFCR